jgi:hypothetical protein
MEWLKAIEAIIRQWWTYATWCVEADMRAPICRPFWTWVVLACAAVGFLGLVWIAAKVISYRIKLAAALKAEEARNRVADAETLREYVWKGDDKARATDPRHRT